MTIRSSLSPVSLITGSMWRLTYDHMPWGIWWTVRVKVRGRWIQLRQMRYTAVATDSALSPWAQPMPYRASLSTRPQDGQGHNGKLIEHDISTSMDGFMTCQQLLRASANRVLPVGWYCFCHTCALECACSSIYVSETPKHAHEHVLPQSTPFFLLFFH